MKAKKLVLSILAALCITMAGTSAVAFAAPITAEAATSQAPSLLYKGKNIYCYKNGRRVAGWQKVGSYWYYFSPSSGIAYRGLATIGGQIYFFNPGGAHMMTGWIKINGYWLYFLPSGEAVRSRWYTIYGARCYFDASGHYIG